jgi:hypothetical protein
MPRATYQARTKPAFVLKMRELGYLVEQQQETVSMLMGLVVAQAEELLALERRVKEIEGRQPAVFIR